MTMRIAIVSLHFAEYSARLALALAKDHQVLLIMRRDNADAELVPALLDRLRRRVSLSLVEHRMLRDPRVVHSAIRIMYAVQHFSPHVVHFQEYVADYAAAAWWLLRRSYPMVLTVHDHLTHSGIDSNLAVRKCWYRGKMRRSADHLIVHGDSIRSETMRHEQRTVKEVSSVRHGVLGAEPEVSFVEPSSKMSLLFFGRIEAYKGLGILLEALGRIQDMPTLTLTIAGHGSDLDRHRIAISRDPRIRLIDKYVPAEEIPHLFHKHAVVVMPYLDATQSGVAALAFAFGRPVIATRTGALPEIVCDGTTGMLVPAGDAFTLESAIRILLSDKALWTRLAHGAWHFAREALDWNRIAEKTIEVYGKAVKCRAACAIGRLT